MIEGWEYWLVHGKSPLMLAKDIPIIILIRCHKILQTNYNVAEQLTELKFESKNVHNKEG